MILSNPFKSQATSALENAMYYANGCCKSTDISEALLKLKDLRKVFLRKIQSDQIALSYMSPVHSAPNAIFYPQLFGTALSEVAIEMEEITIKKETLNLAQDCVMPTPWHPKSMKANIGIYGLGNGRRPWIHQPLNHKVKWIPTFAIGIVEGGNHSLTAAVITNELTHLNIKESCDLSKMFESYYFDGRAYKEKGSRKFSSIPEISEFGIVFELSRKIHELQNSGGRGNGTI